MLEILNLLIKYKILVIIFIKLDLILRDYDLIDKLFRIIYINVVFIIIIVNEDI